MGIGNVWASTYGSPGILKLLMQCQSQENSTTFILCKMPGSLRAMKAISSAAWDAPIGFMEFI